VRMLTHRHALEDSRRWRHSVAAVPLTPVRP
jgi:hypothetical protein